MAGLGIGPLLSAVVGGAGAGYARQTNINRDRDLREEDMLFRQDMALEASDRAEERHQWSFEEKEHKKGRRFTTEQREEEEYQYGAARRGQVDAQRDTLYEQGQADRTEKKETERAAKWRDAWGRYSVRYMNNDKQGMAEAVLEMNKYKDSKRHKGSFLTSVEAPTQDFEGGEDGMLFIGEKGKFVEEDGKPMVVPRSVLEKTAQDYLARTKPKEKHAGLGTVGTFDTATGKINYAKGYGADGGGDGFVKNGRGVKLKESDVRAMETSARNSVRAALGGIYSPMSGWSIKPGTEELAMEATAYAMSLYLSDKAFDSVPQAVKYAIDAANRAKKEGITLKKWLEKHAQKAPKPGADRANPPKGEPGNKDDFVGKHTKKGRAGAGPLAARPAAGVGVPTPGGVSTPGRYPGNTPLAINMRDLEELGRTNRPPLRAGPPP